MPGSVSNLADDLSKSKEDRIKHILEAKSFAAGKTELP